MLFHRARVASLLGLVIASPTLAHSDSFTGVFGSNASFESLQRAYQAVHSDSTVQELLGAGNVNALSISAKANTYGVETTKFQHYYKGLEVMGSMSFHHATANHESVNNVISQFDLDVTPSLTPNMAVAIAKSIAGDHELTQAPELKILPSTSGGSAQLIYWVDFATQGLNAGSDVLLDAQTGRIIAHISKLETLATVHVMTAKAQGLQILPVAVKNETTGKYEIQSCKVTDLDTGTNTDLTLDDCKKLARGQTTATDDKCTVVLLSLQVKPGQVPSGDPLAIDPASCKKVVLSGVATPQADQAAINALNNSNKVLAYYKNTHGRDSFDGNGTEVVNVVHAGVNYGNAAWVQGMDFMLYGDGDGELMGDMTKGLDVAGHEMTHGVTSKTAKLTMMNEAGALNEANSDFFGKMIAQDGTWVMGKTLSLDLTKFPGIRDLANPGSLRDTYHDADGNKVNKPYPSKVSEQEKKKDTTTCDGSNDRCWVHYNSTIPSHAAYLIVQSIGKSKAEMLYYLQLTHYLTSEATFKTAAQATMDACQALTDTGKLSSRDCDQAKAAFVEVGMM